jgi:hypothetical protein
LSLLIQIQSISEVLPELYLTGSYGSSKLDKLESLKITHIVNCASIECESPFETHFQYLKLPLRDTSDQTMLEAFDKSISFIERALAANKDSKILIHCAMGVSRYTLLFINKLRLRSAPNLICYLSI